MKPNVICEDQIDNGKGTKKSPYSEVFSFQQVMILLNN